jgi:hypothetical protein
LGERTTGGDIANVIAKTVSKAEAVAPVRRPLTESCTMVAAIASTSSRSQAAAWSWACVKAGDSVGVSFLRLAKTPGRAPFAAGLWLVRAI